MTESWPDIEIYLKRPDLDAIRQWLDERLGIRDEFARGEARVFLLGEAALECVVIENAVRGGYTSVWFRSAQTPWPDDRSCAVEAHERFGIEVRCSAGPWEDGDDEDGNWIRLTDQGEQRANWRT